MTDKPRMYPVPEANPQHGGEERDNERGGQPEPLSGSKKVKNRTHVSHHNPQG